MPDVTPVAKDGKRMALAWAFSLLASTFGIMLLVVGKVTAGIAFVLAALLVLPLLDSWVSKSRLPKWAQLGLVLLLCAIAVMSISGTDIPPSNSVTGYKFVDQLLTLVGAFWERIS